MSCSAINILPVQNDSAPEKPKRGEEVRHVWSWDLPAEQFTALICSPTCHSKQHTLNNWLPSVFKRFWMHKFRVVMMEEIGCRDQNCSCCKVELFIMGISCVHSWTLGASIRWSFKKLRFLVLASFFSPGGCSLIQNSHLDVSSVSLSHEDVHKMTIHLLLRHKYKHT